MYSSRTYGLKALERICDTDEVLSIRYARTGVWKLSLWFRRGEMRRAVDQPEALLFIKDNNSWNKEKEYTLILHPP